ncbi:MAG: substrate-binding domain-containing protein, partial [Gemmatimonadaceae bacterium]|nr:substrate-binding domain-containing protein [Chitinophagaceae bacterium]
SHIEELSNKGIPMVFFDRVCETIDASRITTDDYESGFKATEHLIESGSKKIAYLSISETLSITNKRMQGYQDALAKHKIEADPAMIIQCSNDTEHNQELITALLSGKNPPDGIFASVERLAIATYHVCAELKINIPEKVKIISFSNLETASLLNPSMTTIMQPAYNMGMKAASVLFKRLEKNNFNNREVIVMNSLLVVRDSTKSGK